MGKKDNISFTMIGRTNANKYQSLIREAERNGINVMGEIPNELVNKLLEQSHILVNISLQEGFSNTFIQAWMRKVPVVSLNVDPDDILKNEGIGFHSPRTLLLFLRNFMRGGQRIERGFGMTEKKVVFIGGQFLQWFNAFGYDSFQWG